MSTEGIEKGAMLLLSLGENEAAEVLRNLTPRAVQRLGLAMAQFRGAPKGRFEEAFDQMRALSADGNNAEPNPSRVRQILTRALGEERAKSLLSRIIKGTEHRALESLKWMDAANVAQFIKGEHPQIIATILIHLDEYQAGEIVSLFPDRLRNDVILRIATIEGVQPQALEALNQTLEQMQTHAPIERTFKDGVRMAANILNFVDASAEQTVMESVRNFAPDLADRIVDEMFVFENLAQLRDLDVQALLRELTSESLVVALKRASGNLREKVFNNMSQRSAEALREDLEARGPVRLSEVEHEQKEILRIARRLSEEGVISLFNRSQQDHMV